MTPEQQIIALAELAGPNEFVGLKKCGLWYSPKACGYTNCECEAGRYTREEAKKHEYRPPRCDDPVTIVEFTTPDHLGDLNAIRALVLKLGARPNPEGIEWQMCFVQELHRVAAVHGDMGWGMATAGPDKLCEAILRTAGKWVEA